jgi:fucose 4-O-acetylase-like acetyltransferase
LLCIVGFNVKEVKSLKKYFEEIDYLKGWAILLVLIGHSATNTMMQRPVQYEYIVRFIYSFHMASFFFASGFLSVDLLAINSISKYYTLAKKKFRSVLIPYITFSLITNCLDLIMKVLKNQSVSYLEYFAKTVFYPELGGMGALWFLYTLFIVQLIVPFIKGFNFKVILLASAILCVALPQNIYFLSLSRVWYFIFFYLLGLRFNSDLTALYKSIIQYNKKVIMTTICFAPILTFIWIFIRNGFVLDGAFFRTYSFICSNLGVFGSIMLVCRLKNYKIRTILRFFGKHSLDIYLLSWPFQVLSILLVTRFKFSYNTFFISNFLSGLLSIPTSLFIVRKVPLLSQTILGQNKK